MKIEGDNNVGEFSVPEVGFFEGTEKLLEVWFTSSDEDETTNNNNGDLRIIPRLVFFPGVFCWTRFKTLGTFFFLTSKTLLYVNWRQIQVESDGLTIFDVKLLELR